LGSVLAASAAMSRTGSMASAYADI
jgi:hypothetical protein